MSGSEEKNGGDTSAQELVDTLFGEREELSVHEKNSRAAHKELPNFLFGRSDAQDALPLSDVSYYEATVIEEDNLKFLAPYIDELSLFETQWGI